MEKGEQSLTPPISIFNSQFSIYEQPLEHPLILPDPRRRWWMAVRPPPPSAGGRKPEGRQPTEGYESVEDVRRRVQRKHRRSPAA